MLAKKSLVCAVTATCLGFTCWAPAYAADNTPGQVHRVVKSGEYPASKDDLVEIAVSSNPSLGPSNPAAKLKLEVSGDGLKKVGIYYAPPARAIPGAAGELRAYLTADENGTAKVKVTPINGGGQEGTPLEFTFKVAKR